MDYGRRITGGGSGYAALLEHAGGVLYGMELGSVTLKRIGLFCFPIKHSTHTRKRLGSGDLKNKQSHTQGGGVNGHIYFASVRTRYGCLIGRVGSGFLFGSVRPADW